MLHFAQSILVFNKLILIKIKNNVINLTLNYLLSLFKEIKRTVRDFSKRDDLKKVDSCFVIITSHGTEDEKGNTEIQGIDYASTGEQENYEKVLCTDVMDYFTAEACSHLAEKPKIFIFQLCRYVVVIILYYILLILHFFSLISSNLRIVNIKLVISHKIICAC